MGLFGSRRKKHGLYYLLPGMTRANRVKRRRVLRWSIAIGLVASVVVGGALWYLNR
jgi:hypothetical protein